MKLNQTFAAGGTVAQMFDRSADGEAAAARLRAAGFPDVRLSESAGRTTETHVTEDAGTTELDFAGLLEQAGFSPAQAGEMTRAVAAGGVLLTVAAGNRAADAAAVLAGESVAARPLRPVDVLPSTAAPSAPANSRAASWDALDADAHAVAPIASATEVEAGDRVVPLRAERLDVNKERTTSEARIRKEIVTEQRTITVPVQREQLVIERDGEAPVRIPLSESQP